MTPWHIGGDEVHVCGCFVRRSIVLLHLPVVIPLASTLEHLVALWDEKVTQYICVLMLCYSSVGALSFWIDVVADLLVCACHKLEAGDTMIRHTHVHMGSNAMLGSGNNSSCGWGAPPASRSAFGMQSEVLVCD